MKDQETTETKEQQELLEISDEEKQAVSDEIVTGVRPYYVDGFDGPITLFDFTPELRQRADVIRSKAILQAHSLGLPSEEDFIDACIQGGKLDSDFREQRRIAQAEATRIHLKAMRTNKEEHRTAENEARRKVAEMNIKIAKIVSGTSVEAFSAERRAAFLCSELCYHDGARLWETPAAFEEDTREGLKSEMVFAVMFREQGIDDSFFEPLRETLSGNADSE